MPFKGYRFLRWASWVMLPLWLIGHASLIDWLGKGWADAIRRHDRAAINRYFYLRVSPDEMPVLSTDGYMETTLLEVAVEEGDDETVTRLLRRGANPMNGYNRTVNLGNFDIFKRCVNTYVEEHDINSPLDEGSTETLLSATVGEWQNEDELKALVLIDYLLRLGADPNRRNWNGDTAVREAANAGNWKTVRLLKAAGGKP